MPRFFDCMKNLSLNKSKIIFGAASILMLLVCVFGIRGIISQSAPYMPENKVSVMDNERSQVFVSGTQYNLDVKTKKKHEAQQEKRREILQKREQTRQLTPVRRRLISTRKPVKKPAVVPVKTKKKDPSKTKKSGSPTKKKDKGKPEKPGKKEEPEEPPKQDEPEEPSDPKDPKEGKEGDKDDDTVAKEENMLPLIESSLIDGRKIEGTVVNFWVTATDYKKQNIPVFSNGEGHFEVYLNGSKITSAGASGEKTNFRAEVEDGVNTIKIEATDKRDKTAVKTYNIRCDVNEPNKIVGSVTVSVSAPSLGIGNIFSGQKVDITEQEPLRDILSDAFKAQGISAEMTSSYLAALKKTGIAKKATITDSLRDKAEEMRVTLKEREDWPDGWQNRLKEKDFCSSSGWVYYVNGSMPDVGIGSYIPSDGDEISLVFILFDGDTD